MLVDPHTVRPADLLIGKAVWRLPFADQCAPAERDAADADAVIDRRSFFNFNRQRAEKAEMQIGRRNAVQVFRLAEKIEYFFQWPGDDGFFFEDVEVFGDVFLFHGMMVYKATDAQIYLFKKIKEIITPQA